ncbi:hypothetical protein D3C87_1487940 [compost metagenome]
MQAGGYGVVACVVDGVVDRMATVRAVFRLGRLVVFKAQEVVQRAQLVGQAGVCLPGQVVDADVFQAIQREGRLEPCLARWPQRRHVLQREARARSEGAHVAATDEGLGAGLGGLHQQAGLKLRVRLVQQAAVAQWFKPFQAGAVFV